MTNKTVILIVDDEIQIINALRRLFHKMNYEIIEAATPENALSIINNTKLHVVICDYNMPNINGIDVLKHSKKVLPDAVRILMTGYCDIKIAISAINEGSVFYYISKPWKNEEVVSVIQSALDTLEKKQNLNKQKMTNNLKKVAVLEDDNILLLNREDIFYLAADGGDVLIFANGEEYKSQESLNMWSGKLSENRFFRCHRSFIVNLEKIEKIFPWFNGTYIKLKNCKDNIPVSRGNVRELKELLGI
jgi:two-component system response regulator LytT